jgi:hypothetical protein
MTASEAAAVLAELREFRAEIRGEVRAIRADNDRGESVHVDHENRLRSLEKVRWMIAGGCLLAGSGLGAWLSQALGG